MTRSCLALLLVPAILTGLAWAGDPGVEDRYPIYVGVAACTECHAGPEAGHQFSLWRLSEHAEAYAALWSREAKEIARLSGILEAPHEAPTCLGCHATAYDVEAWEREDGFRIEDGVQCEVCHGPGSEYMDPQVMADRGQAMAHGLKMPDQKTCMRCHKEKGSHVAVLKQPVYPVERLLARIAHPKPKDTGAARAEAPHPHGTQTSTHAFLGVTACAKCHRGPKMGFQFSRWRLGPHAHAYATLATPKAREIAAQAGVQEDPQTSRACLTCHTTAAAFTKESLGPAFDPRDGVQCESCHGAGGDFAVEAVMLDEKAAQAAGLQEVSAATCTRCHAPEKAHGRPFAYDTSVKMQAHPLKLAQGPGGPVYKTPLQLALTPDGREIYVACEASGTVIVVDVAARRKVAEIATGAHPHDVTFAPDGARAYVSNRGADTVSVIDTRTRAVTDTIVVGDEPHGLLLDETGGLLYVLNTASEDVSVVDTGTLKELRRLPASRGPWSLARSPDGEVIVATNTLSKFVPFRAPSISELTILNAAGGYVEDRVEVPGANILQGIHWHPSGRFALFTLNRTKNLVPMTRLLQGWTITNGLGVLWRDGRVDQVLLDEPHMCFPDPADVAVSPDGKLALVTSSGDNRVAVVDVEKMIAMLEGADEYEREHVFPNHLGKPTAFVRKHIETKASPRGVLFAEEGRTAFVANALDDSLTVIDVAGLDAVGRVDLGGPTTLSKARRGELAFHSANITFRRQFSCHTCHPDGHVDGLTYDIEPDGIGIAPVDNRTLRGILDTAPFKWEGTNPTLQRQCGPRLAVFFTRIQPFTPEQLSALEHYICTIPRPPNRHRELGGELTPAQRRGKAMFERTHRNDGTPIAEQSRCVTCHFPPLFTDRSRRDVGTRMWLDREVEFDVPHLTNVYDSSPYLHNGISPTLEEIWTRYNPDDRHGVTNDMTKDQLNDLIEYLKTL